MRFIIGRTSDTKDIAAPVLGAIKVPYVQIDERTVDNPAKLRDRTVGPTTWYNYGRNHRVINGHIMRDIDRICWEIEIASLEELLLLVKREGKIIVHDSGGIPRLEIYDAYRE